MMVSQDNINTKLRGIFEGVIVNKKLLQIREVARLPRYVAEYLVTKFCTDGDSKEGLKELSEFIRTYYPETKDKDKVLHDLMERGTVKIIDDFKVETSLKLSTHKLIIPCLNLRDAMILDSILNEYENLLRAGMWGLAELKYVPSIVPRDRKGNPLMSPLLMKEFTPFQASDVDLKEFTKKRNEFSTEEWIDILINTIGLNQERYNKRTKLILLQRLIPLVENNTNVLELGPRATGKTYLQRNISYYSRIISGGRISPAVLFFNIGTKTLGEIGVKDCVIFDEIARISFANPDEMMGKLKDYMESGHFERGPKKGHSTCSLILMGNIEIKEEIPVEDYTFTLPEFMRDTAFIDRIHGFLPGWELPKISKSGIHLSPNYGFASDYFCEILHEFRKIDFQNYVSQMVSLGEDLTIRDEKSILKLASGMLKILCPHGKFGSEEIKLSIDLAIEARQRLADWLHYLSPEEFKKIKITYDLVS